MFQAFWVNLVPRVSALPVPKGRKREEEKPWEGSCFRATNSVTLLEHRRYPRGLLVKVSHGEAPTRGSTDNFSRSKALGFSIFLRYDFCQNFANICST